MTKIAIASDNDRVSPHFGHCAGYTLATIEGGRTLAVDYVANPGHEPGLLPRLLAKHGVNCIIAGGIGYRAQEIFARDGISCLTGVQGTVTDTISMFAAGALVSGDSLCDHETSGDSSSEHACRDGEDVRRSPKI